MKHFFLKLQGCRANGDSHSGPDPLLGSSFAHFGAGACRAHLTYMKKRACFIPIRKPHRNLSSIFAGPFTGIENGAIPSVRLDHCQKIMIYGFMHMYQTYVVVFI